MLTPRYLRMKYWLSQAVLVGAMLYLFVGFAQAQSQDYINAVNATEIANLKKQVEDLNMLVQYVLVASVGSLAAQALNLRNSYKKDK
jgi:hypothetical protein